MEYQRDKRRNKAKRHKRKLWLLCRARKLLRKRKARKNIVNKKLIGLIGALGIDETNYRNVAYGIAEKRLVLALPEELDFDENYEITTSHLRILRKAVETGTKIRRIDFSRIKKLSTSAALVLASTVDQWKDRVKGSLKAELPTWGMDITRLLCQMGYFELLDLRRPPQNWEDSSGITYLPFLKGRVGEDKPGEKAKHLRVEIEKLVGEKIKKHLLFEGISEAITNVCQHAYEGVNDERRKFWWLSASYDDLSRELRITFYDKGIGIPKTLPAHKKFEIIRQLFHAWTDSRKVKAAMEIGRTASGLSERGKGLQNLIEFAKAHTRGSLRVTSLRGSYEEFYESMSDGQRPPQISRKDHRCSIGGTLIEWSVIL